jgi:hypothetical protein
MSFFSKKVWIIVVFVGLVHNSSAQFGGIVVPYGHSYEPNAVVVSPNGKYIYASEGGKVIMWERKSKSQIYTFNTSGVPVISPDGKYLATSGEKGLKCFNTKNGTLVFEIEGITGNVYFTKNSTILYYAGQLWNESTFKHDVGIIGVDLTTLKSFYVEGTENTLGNDFATFTALNNDLILLPHKKGWQVMDINKKNIVFTSNFELEYNVSGSARNRYMLAIPGTTVVVSKEFLAVAPYTKCYFYDALSGKQLYSIASSDNPEFSTDVDNNLLLINAGSDMPNHLLVDIKNGFKTIKTFSKESYGHNLNGAKIQSSQKTIFWPKGLAISEIDIPSGKIMASYEGKVNMFSPISLMTKAGPTNKITLNTDDSYLNDLDLNRLVTTNNRPFSITNKDAVLHDVMGNNDTLLVDYEPEVWFLNTKTAKKTVLTAPVHYKTFDNDRPNIFVGATAKSYYGLTNRQVNDRYIQTISRFNLGTNTATKLFDFGYFAGFNPELDLFICYEKPKSNQFEPVEITLKVQDLLKNLPIFKAQLTILPNELLFSAQIVNNGTELIVFTSKFCTKYNLINSEIISRSPEYLNSNSFQKYEFAPNGKYILELDGGNVYKLDTKGQRLSQNGIHQGEIKKVVFSANERYIFTFGLDRTMKVIDTQNNLKVLGTFYLFNGGKDYVFVAPDGRFDGTPEGIKQLYYVKNTQKVPLDVVYEKFYTPQLYQRLLNEEVFEPIDFELNPMPVAKILYEEVKRNLTIDDEGPQQFTNNTGFAKITINATAPNDKVDEIRLFHNSKIVTLSTRNLLVTDADGIDSKTFTINLLPGRNTFRAIALNGQRTESTPDEVIVNFQSNGQQPNSPIPGVASESVLDNVDKNATLHLIVVGINQYQNPKLSLNYALADATAFKNEIEKDAKSLLASTKVYFVTDAKADKKGIEEAFNTVKQNAKPQDVLVFYYAGHGVISAQNKEFYLVPTDIADLSNVDAQLAEKGIPSKLLQSYAVDIQAQKQLFILDACQSAGAFENLLKNDADKQKSLAVVARSTGTHWLAASGSQQYANEFASLGHGIFTYVLLEALQGKALVKNMITVNGLKTFVQSQVPELMKKYNGTAQYPASYGSGNDFPVELK